MVASISASLELDWTGTKFTIWPWSLFWTKILFCLILIVLHSTPLEWIRKHPFFSRRDSVRRSSRVIILISSGSDLALDNNKETLIVRVSLTKIGRGLDDWSQYLPSLKRSRIDKGLMLLSPSVAICVTLSRSCSKRSCLGVPLLNSLIPYITTLNLRSSWSLSLGLLAIDLLVAVGWAALWVISSAEAQGARLFQLFQLFLHFCQPRLEFSLFLSDPDEDENEIVDYIVL